MYNSTEELRDTGRKDNAEKPKIKLELRLGFRLGLDFRLELGLGFRLELGSGLRIGL